MKQKLKRLFLGERPKLLLFFLVPTLVALVLDLVLRARLIVGYALQGKAIYGSSWLVSAGFWGLPLWLAAWLWARGKSNVGDRKRLAARIGVGILFAFWILPLATLGYGGQTVYYQVVHAYMGRDTVRLGFALRGTVREWFTAWGNPLAFVGMLLCGLLVTAIIGYAVRRAATHMKGLSARPPLLAVLTFVGALFTFWIDMVDSRFLQAALPDDCFVHGVVHAVSVGITGKGRTRRGVSLRTPAKLPLLEPAAHRPNVLLILLESVRADALCSANSQGCKAQFLDEVIPERISLGKTTTPSPGTFGACVLLWTGLPATADPNAAHSAPVLWEIARAAGYRTAYITSQNLVFENFGAFVQIAGIDKLVTASELGGLRQEQLGAPDERATASMLDFVRGASTGAAPWFGVLHLSNTHAPYRVDPELQPFAPHSIDPLGDANAFHNHYRNSVLFQERTIASFLRELKTLPSWDDTAVLLVSDHGEQFRERGGLYHLHSLYDEEVRVPGFIAAGKNALDADQRAALATFATHRTYLTDVNATLVDLMGQDAARRTFPFANGEARSLVRKPGFTGDTLSLMAIATAVWDDDTVRYGVMSGERLLMGTPHGSWTCFDIARDPQERNALPPEKCGPRMQLATGAFPPL